MKPILNPWFNQFVAEWFPEDSNGTDQARNDLLFEAFCNFYVINSRQKSAAKPETFRTASLDGGPHTNDWHIDGVGLFVNGIQCETKEAVATVAENNTTISVELHLLQAKNGKDALNAGALNNFLSGVRDFIADEPWSDEMIEARAVNEHLVEAQWAFVETLKHRFTKQHRVHLHWCVSSRDNAKYADDIAASVRSHAESLAAEKADLAEIKPPVFYGAEELISAANSLAIRNSAEFELPTNSRLPLPSAADPVGNSFFAYVPGGEYMKIIAPDDRLDTRIFDENVRDFKGKDTEVYKQIMTTLRNDIEKGQFPLRNNGVTILAERIDGPRTCTIENFQIVNGCQTSNVLFDFYSENEHDPSCLEDVFIPVRFIRTEDAEVIDHVVYATNCQEPVKPQEVAARSELARKLEQHSLRDDVSHRIAFERRQGQYLRNKPPVPHDQVLDKTAFTAAFVACAIGSPHEAIGYVDSYVSGKKSIWREQQSVPLLYACGYLSNRITTSTLYSSKYRNLRFHLMNSVFAQLAPEFPEAYSNFKRERSKGQVSAKTFDALKGIAESLLKKIDDQATFERALARAIQSADELAKLPDFQPTAKTGVIPRQATKVEKSTMEFKRIDDPNRPRSWRIDH